MIQPFHLAIPVHNLELCREFYVDCFECELGRSSENWQDLSLYGHQLVLHVDPNKKTELAHNPVDGHEVPIPHFGVVLKWDQWHKLKERLKSKNINFIIEPYIRFKGKPGEQATMFFLDPAGNALEFKAFQDISNLFK